jgi:preprotein translocase subunit SecD
MRRFLKTKALLLFGLLALSIMMITPSIAQILGRDKELPGWLTDTFKSRFKLGLDLQGGLHLEYSVAVDEALENKLDQIASELESASRRRRASTSTSSAAASIASTSSSPTPPRSRSPRTTSWRSPSRTWSGSTPRTRRAASSTSR